MRVCGWIYLNIALEWGVEMSSLCLMCVYVSDVCLFVGCVSECCLMCVSGFDGVELRPALAVGLSFLCLSERRAVVPLSL